MFYTANFEYAWIFHFGLQIYFLSIRMIIWKNIYKFISALFNSAHLIYHEINYRKLITEVTMKKIYLIIVLIISMSNLANSQIKYVTPAGAGSKDGTTWSNAYDNTQLQTAIDASGVTQVWVAAGTYTPTVVAPPRDAKFSLKSGVAIYGGFAGNEGLLTDRNWGTNHTILSGEIGDPSLNADNCIHVVSSSGTVSGTTIITPGPDATAILDGFVITDGYNGIGEGKGGGGIYTEASSPTISNCTITGNTGSFGAGVYCLIASPTLTNCIITYNSGRSGAGIFIDGSSPTLVNCMISYNTASENGGGVCTSNDGSTTSLPVLTNCTIVGNSANDGGGVKSGNEAGSSTTTINNSIIWGNSAIRYGKQLYNSSGTSTLNYCCYSNGTNDIEYTGTFSPISSITADPQFANAGSNDYRIVGTSPCKDTGSDGLYSISFTTIDLRGQLRKNGTIDMGAYEWTTTVDPAGGTTFTWTGGTNTNWNTAGNWNPATVPSATDIVSIPDVANDPTVSSTVSCKELTLASGATLTITTTGALTVNGNLANGGSINILSDASNTGSLIAVSSSGSGNASAQLYLTTSRWHLVSPPLSGTIQAFLANPLNSNIPTNGSSQRGMMDYNPATNNWNSFFTGSTTGSLGGGKGFSMRSASDGNITFTGLLQTGIIPVSTVLDKWCSVGNPYTSAIGVVFGSSSTSNFLTTNASNLDPLYGAIYVWDKADASNGNSGNYTAISNASPPLNTVQLGQAFMVKMKLEVSSVSFNQSMQIHGNSLPLKSAKVAWPTIKLVATVNNAKSSTTIAFNKEMTNGLDPTYDAGLFSGGADLSVYTKLVADNGIPFAVQALPENYNNLIIPVGIESKSGGEVVFSSELLNLPTECLVILEDKQTKTFTDLSKSVYTTIIDANTTSGRFQLHTSYLTTGVNTETLAELNAYPLSNNRIKIDGIVSNQAIATLYDTQGRMILSKILEEGNLNILNTPNLHAGIFILYVKDNGKSKTFKIPVIE